MEKSIEKSIESPAPLLVKSFDYLNEENFSKLVSRLPAHERFNGRSFEEEMSRLRASEKRFEEQGSRVIVVEFCAEAYLNHIDISRSETVNLASLNNYKDDLGDDIMFTDPELNALREKMKMSKE